MKVVLAVAILVGVNGCSDDAHKVPIDAVVAAPVDADPLVHCQFPTDCDGATAPYCCVHYSPGLAFEGSMCEPTKCVFRTCDPNAAQPCPEGGVCNQEPFTQDGRKWWTCGLGNH
jgi:hypothetical protein